MKKFLSLFLAILMATTLFAIPAQAATVSVTTDQIESMVTLGLNAYKAKSTASALTGYSTNTCGRFVYGYCINKSSLGSAINIPTSSIGPSDGGVRYLLKKNAGTLYIKCGSIQSGLESYYKELYGSNNVVISSSFTPQRGDIVLFGWTAKATSHVALMTSSKKYVHASGNTLYYNSLSETSQVTGKAMSASVYGYFRFNTGSSSETPVEEDVTVSFTTQEETTTQTNAVITTKISKNGGSCTALKFTLTKNDGSTEECAAGGAIMSSSQSSMEYKVDINQDMGIQLQSGTYYDYEVSAFVNGKWYSSGNRAFITRPNNTKCAFAGANSSSVRSSISRGYPSYGASSLDTSYYCYYKPSNGSYLSGYGLKIYNSNGTLVKDCSKTFTPYQKDECWYYFQINLESDYQVTLQSGKLYYLSAYVILDGQKFEDELKAVYISPEMVGNTQWESYPCFFNLNGGSCDMSSIYVTDGKKIGWLPTPLRAGYKFLGWSTTNDASGIVSVNTILPSLSLGVYKYSLNAIWQKEKLSSPIITGVTTDLTTGNIKLSWTAVDSAVSYYIYRCIEGSSAQSYTKIGNVTGKTFTDTSAVAGKTYSYKVQAVSSDTEKNSELSTAVSCQCVCPMPTGFKATVKNGKVVLSWNKIEGAEKYVIWIDGSKLKTVTKNSYTDSTLEVGASRTYCVAAVAGGESSAYTSSKTVTMICQTPTLYAINQSTTGKPVLYWKAVAGAYKYRIYRSTAKNGDYTLIKTTDQLSYTNTNAKVGTTYYYKIKAVSKVKGTDSSVSSAVSITCVLPAPSISIKNYSGKPAIIWEKVSGAKYYRVYRSTSRNGTYKLIKSTTSRYYIDKSAVKGKKYYYKVKAMSSLSGAHSGFSNIKYLKATK